MIQVQTLRAVISIGIGLSLATIAYYYSFAFSLLDPLSRWTAEGLVLLLDAVGMEVKRSGAVVFSGNFGVAIDPGCTPLGPLLLYLGAVLGYPASLIAVLKGCLIGIVFLTVLNFIRVMSLFLIGVHAPSLLEVMHVLVTQSLMILAAVGLWLFWVQRYVRKAHA